uniref:Uncharacterized protein n=1 Tax=Cucumis melo TaxID=3656 RepID=A0A9I9EDM5_CUCME
MSVVFTEKENKRTNLIVSASSSSLSISFEIAEKRVCKLTLQREFQSRTQRGSWVDEKTFVGSCSNFEGRIFSIRITLNKAVLTRKGAEERLVLPKHGMEFLLLGLYLILDRFKLYLNHQW